MAIPRDGGNPTRVNDAISALPSYLPLVGWLVGSLAYYTHYASSTLPSSPLSSSIKTFPLPLSHLSSFSQPSLSHSLNGPITNVGQSGWSGRTTTECKGMQRSGLSLSKGGREGGAREQYWTTSFAALLAAMRGGRPTRLMHGIMTCVRFVDQG